MERNRIHEQKVVLIFDLGRVFYANITYRNVRPISDDCPLRHDCTSEIHTWKLSRAKARPSIEI